MLNLLTGTKLYVKNRLYDGNKKIRSDTPFFRPNGILPTDGLIREKVKSIPTGETARLTK